MKKAKIFLTALTVLAVAGGALAFKAKLDKTFAFCDLNSLKCTLSSFVTKQTTTNIGGVTVSYNEFNKPCVNDPIQGWTCTTRVTISQ